MRYVPGLLLFLLLMLSCKVERAPRPTNIVDSSTIDMTPSPFIERRAIPIPAKDTLRWADTTKAPGKTVYTWGRVLPPVVVIDSSRTVLADVIQGGVPFGLFHLPADSLCKGLGYSAVAFTVQASLDVDLAKIRGCKGRAVLLLPRGKSIVAGNLSVAGMIQTILGRDSIVKGVKVGRIAGWDSAAVARALADSTIIAVNVGDDITAAEYGSAPLATRLARWDSAAVAIRQRWPSMPVSMRAVASQLRLRSWQGVTVLWVQYRGPYRDRQPQIFATGQADSAKALNLGLMLGLNLLDGGCGPATDQPADTTRRCPKGIPGSALAGTWGATDSAATSVHHYLMSGPEVAYYGAAFLPVGCAQINWQWSPVLYSNSGSARWNRVRKYHTDSLVKAAAKTVGLIAKSRPFTRCSR